MPEIHQGSKQKTPKVPLLMPRFFLASQSWSWSFNNLRNLQNVGQTTPQIIPNLWRYTTASVNTQAGRQKLKHRRYAWTSERRMWEMTHSIIADHWGGLQCRLVFPTFQTTNSHSINSNNQRKESRLQSTNVAQIESNLSQKGIECSGPSSCDVLKVVSIPTHKYKWHMAYRSMCKQLHKPRNWSSGYIGILSLGLWPFFAVATRASPQRFQQFWGTFCMDWPWQMPRQIGRALGPKKFHFEQEKGSFCPCATNSSSIGGTRDLFPLAPGRLCTVNGSKQMLQFYTNLK